MKNLKKFLAIILSITMVVCSTLPSVASEIEVIDETTKSKIEEQLREDLGEERANEILNVGENADDVGAKLGEPEETRRGERSSEPEEEETTVADEETTVGSNADDGALLEEEETTDVEDEETTVAEEETTVGANVDDVGAKLGEPDEEEEETTSVGANACGARPEDEEETTIASISEPEEIVISIASKSTTDKNLYGVDEAWMYWYLTDENGDSTFETIHFTNTYQSGATGVTADNSISYTGFEKSDITTAIFDTQINAKTCSCFFEGFTKLTSIENLEYLITEDVKYMDGMFQACQSLENLNLTNFNTSNVIDMEEMFHQCYSIMILDLISFNTINLTGMNGMFSECTSLETIIVSNNFVTSSVENDYGVFAEATKLVGCNGTQHDSTKIDSEYAHIDEPGNPGYFSLAPWMYWYLDGSPDNKIIHYTNSKPTSGGVGVTRIDKVVYNRLSEKDKIIIATFEDEIDAKTCDSFFKDFTSLTTINNLKNLSTSAVTNMSCMFYSCTSLREIDFDLSEKFDTSKVTNMSSMFGGCSAITELDLINFDTANVAYMEGMFSQCSSLKIIYASDKFVVSNYIESLGMFESCTSIVGDYGTTYESGKTAGNYAHLDEPGNPGYFSRAPWMYWYLIEPNPGLTFNNDRILHLSKSKTKKGAKGIASIVEVSYSDMDELEVNIIKVVIDNEITLKTGNSLFSGFDKITSIEGLDNLNTENVTDMQNMFNNCSSLTSIDLSNFVTTNVTDMSGMFNNCVSLTSIDLSSFVTKNVIKMQNMFAGCNKLKTVVVSEDFVTTNLTDDGSDMFKGCTSLVGVAGTTYDDSNPKDKTYARIDGGTSAPGYFTDAADAPWMYWYLTTNQDPVSPQYTLHLSESNITGSAKEIIRTDEVSYTGIVAPISIVNIVIDNEITLKTGNSLFSGFGNITSIEGLANLKTENVTDMQNMFNNCSSLTSIDLSSFVTKNVTKMQNMFAGCSSLKTIVVSDDFVTTNLTDDGSDMFKGCTSLVGGAGTTYDSSYPKDKTYARIDEGTSNPGYFTRAPWMYWRLEDNETGKTIIFSSTDEGKTGITGIVGSAAIDYGSLDKNTVTKAVFEDEIEAVTCWELFKDFNKLELIEGISNLNTENVTNMEGMFISCDSLTKLDLSSLNTKNVTNMQNMFYNSIKLTDLNLDGIITSNVIFMGGMFDSCISLTNLNLLSFDTQNTTNMVGMFGNCINLETIVVSNEFITNRVTSSDYMFIGCEKLVGCYGTAYDETKTGIEYARIDGYDEHGGRHPGYFSSAPWMYWYLDNNDTAIHYSSIEPANGGVGATRRDRMLYSGLSDEQREKITKATFEDRIYAVTCDSFFKNFRNLSSIENLVYLDTTNVIAMVEMFAKCENLENLHWENLYASKVESMVGMFVDCKKLKSLVLSRWNTESLLSMVCMFYNCSSLTLLDISTFDTSKVKTMISMFTECTSLKELDLSNFNTSNVRNMTYMFAYCSSLESIYVSNEFITTGVIYDEGMFSGCTSIKGSSGTTYDESHIEMEYARIDGGTAAPGYFSSNDWMWWKYNDTEKELHLYGTEQDVYDDVISGSGRIEYTGLPKGDVEKVIFENNVKARTCENMFYEFISLKEIVDIEYLNTSSVMSMEGMFNSCESLDKIDLSKFDTSRVTNMSNMFVSCIGLDELDLTSFNTSNVTDMTAMFNNCENLKSIHLEKLEVSKVKFMTEMFGNCKKLESLNLFRWNAKNLEKIYRMFAGCSSLALLDISNFDTSRVTDMREMFRDCSELTKLDLTKFDTKKVTDFDQFLYCCSKLTSIDLHSFDTSNVKNMRSMFSGCENLVTIFVSSKFVTTSLAFVVGRDVFIGCNALIGGAGTTYDDSHTDIEYARIDGGPTSATPGYFTLYVPPTPPAPTPTYPQNYSSDRDGGGGGSIAGPLVDVIIPAVTYLPIVKNILATLNNTTSKWTKDAVTNKHKLNIINQNGTETPATLGFYNYTNVVTHIVNNVPVQTQTNDTYVFDDKGNMITGWVRTADGKWYLFEYEKTTNEGKMVIGWKKVQGAWYYFGTDGAMLTNAYTPDGHYVGPDGKWVSP